MNTNKRMNTMIDSQTAKRPKKECSYGEKCYRLNPVHFREYSHEHLESILDNYSGTGDYPIPDSLSLQRGMIRDQLDVIVEKKLYEPKSQTSNDKKDEPDPQLQTSTLSSSASSAVNTTQKTNNGTRDDINSQTVTQQSTIKQSSEVSSSSMSTQSSYQNSQDSTVSQSSTNTKDEKKTEVNRTKDPDYRPIVAPNRSPRTFLSVVAPPGGMAAKHASQAPYYIFYTTIAQAEETHKQPYSITFLEILDQSLGELKCSLQINFMVELGWLLAQYYFAGYSAKKLTILYGDDSLPELKTINKKKPHIDAHYVSMPTPFGKHHTKMMILCYEDGSLRVVISTANLYLDDWEDRTQGLWFSPRCPELPPEAMPHDGESPTQFKRSLLNYLNHYHLPQLSFYVERVKRCDFSHINVFLVASAPGSHFDMEWGLSRVGTLLRQHCCIPKEQQAMWPLLAQASSLGSYGKDAKVWLTGDFLNNFSKIKDPPQALTPLPELKLIYPSLENVEQSHLGRLGGGCLPYAASAHAKQPWLLSFLYQWQAKSSHRNKAMPHIKSYTRTSPDNKMAAFYLLTSGNVSKAAWGSVNVGNQARRLLSYEAGVLFLPKFVINEDFFPLEEGAPNRLIIPYDIPPTKYTICMSPWVSDYLS